MGKGPGEGPKVGLGVGPRGSGLGEGPRVGLAG